MFRDSRTICFSDILAIQYLPVSQICRHRIFDIEFLNSPSIAKLKTICSENENASRIILLWNVAPSKKSVQKMTKNCHFFQASCQLLQKQPEITCYSVIKSSWGSKWVGEGWRYENVYFLWKIYVDKYLSVIHQLHLL